MSKCNCALAATYGAKQPAAQSAGAAMLVEGMPYVQPAGKSVLNANRSPASPIKTVIGTQPAPRNVSLRASEQVGREVAIARLTRPFARPMQVARNEMPSYQVSLRK